MAEEKKCGCFAIFAHNNVGDLCLYMCEDKDGKGWAIPGGKPDAADKDALETAKRELREEVGIEAPPFQSLTSFNVEGHTIMFVGITRCANLLPCRELMNCELTKAELIPWRILDDLLQDSEHAPPMLGMRDCAWRSLWLKRAEINAFLKKDARVY